ncbi:hypothetical protein HanRHA438_Chr02g0057871 [Helianthus annuus]|nr:hypothetical protein HanRHA438_Chr02g0057871 [Helianthus annuus]
MHGDRGEDVMDINDSGYQGNSEFQGFGNNNNNKGNSSSVPRGSRKIPFNISKNKHKSKPITTSPGSDNKPKKQIISESKDIFNLNGLSGLGNNKKSHADFNDKGNRENHKEDLGGFDLNTRAVSSNVSELGDSERQRPDAFEASTEDDFNPLFSGMGILEEIQATVLLGNKLGDLGDFSSAVEKIITNEDNNVGYQ